MAAFWQKNFGRVVTPAFYVSRGTFIKISASAWEKKNNIYFSILDIEWNFIWIFTGQFSAPFLEAHSTCPEEHFEINCSFWGKNKFFESRILNEVLEDLLWEIFLWGFKNYAKFPQKLFGLKFLSDIFFQRCRTSDETFFIFRRKKIRQSCQDCILCLQSNISSENVFFWENIGFLSFRQGMNFLWLFPATFPMGFRKLYATFSEVFFGQSFLRTFSWKLVRHWTARFPLFAEKIIDGCHNYVLRVGGNILSKSYF